MNGASQRPSASASAQHRRRMLTVLALTLTIFAAEIVGGVITGSLALLADAGHVLTDAAGVTLAILAATYASRTPTTKRTYGYYRLEILAAVVNALSLFGIAAVILFQARQRWMTPPEIEGGLMLVFALVGFASNLTGVFLLHDGSKASLNVRGAFLNVLGDTLGSAAVIIAAATIAVTGWERADVVASVLVALLMLPAAWTLLRGATDVLLESSPPGTDLTAIRQHIISTPGVLDAHDLHVWTLTSGLPVLSVHIVVADQVMADNRSGSVLDALGACLAQHFDVEHCTFQLEPAGHAHHERPNHN